MYQIDVSKCIKLMKQNVSDLFTKLLLVDNSLHDRLVSVLQTSEREDN